MNTELYPVMTKLHILSDLHLEFGDFNPQAVDADVVVLAGDIRPGIHALNWVKEAFPDHPVVFVPGNHEYYRGSVPNMAAKLKAEAKDSNIHVLVDETAIIQGICFLGTTLWTDFRLMGNQRLAMLAAGDLMNDYRKIRIAPQYRRLKPQDTQRLHLAATRWLVSELKHHSDRPKVVVSHCAPSIASVPQRDRNDPLSAAYASEMSDWIVGAGIDLWIHGHIHDSVDYHIGRTRVICNPRGYVPRTNPVFDPGLVVVI